MCQQKGSEKLSNEIIIQRLKKAMTVKGITVYALAKRIDIRYELLRRVFAGKRNLTAVELIQILQVLEISIEDLT